MSGVARQNTGFFLMTPELFGTLPDGRQIEAVTLSGGGLRARVLTLGAIVQDLRHEALPFSLVRGTTRVGTYLGHMAYVGAMVGRVAGRIGGACFTLDEKTHKLIPNWRGHMLHGGAQGASFRLWQIVDATPNSVTLTLELDCESGFPGRVDLTTRLSLIATGALDIKIMATATHPTPCAPTHHGYFRLDDTSRLDQTQLTIDAAQTLALDRDLIPTGALCDVAGQRLDFRTARTLARRRLDHCFVLRPAPKDGCALRAVGQLYSAQSGLSMRVDTTEPGLQVHTRAGAVALEAQGWPNAVNQPHFPSQILRPNATSHYHTRYTFALRPHGERQ